MRRDLLAGSPIGVRPEPVKLKCGAPLNAATAAAALITDAGAAGKLADRDSIPGHDERFALVKLAHELATVIAKFTRNTFHRQSGNRPSGRAANTVGA